MTKTILPPIHWRFSPNWSHRTTAVDLVVVHRPVSPYESACSWLCNPRAEASAHGVLGRKSGRLEFTQLVRWNDKAWACVAYNSRSDNLEICDEAWDGRDPEAWRVAARIVAFRLRKRGLKPVWIRGKDLDRKGGFTRHYDLGQSGGGHTDPTTSFAVWIKFVWRVKFEYYRGGFRRTWGLD